MSRFPPPLEQRFAAGVRDMLRRLQALENRTAKVSSGDWLYARLGTVDPGYVSGLPQVTVDGDAGLTGPYAHLASYTPAAGDRVLLIPQGTTFVVAGKAVTS